jgi:hypothetical protein
LPAARADRRSLTRSARRADGTSEAGVLVTNAFCEAGANGTLRSAGVPTRLTRSQVEKGAVTGDSVSAINQPAAIFVSIGCERVQQKKRHAMRDLRKGKWNGIAEAGHLPRLQPEQ